MCVCDIHGSLDCHEATMMLSSRQEESTQKVPRTDPDNAVRRGSELAVLAELPSRS